MLNAQRMTLNAKRESGLRSMAAFFALLALILGFSSAAVAQGAAVEQARPVP